LSAATSQSHRMLCTVEKVNLRSKPFPG
jgi:hypothetical protein